MPQADITKLQPVSDYLFGTEVFTAMQEVVGRHELPSERIGEFFDLIDAVAGGAIELVHMPEIVGEAFGVDAEKAKAISVDFAGYCILPLERYLAGVKEQIAAWGGDVAAFPAYRVPKEQLNIDQYAGKITETHGLTLAPQYIKRLGFLVKQYVEGAKHRDAILAFFQRPLAIGGLGLAADVAEKVIADVDKEKLLIEFVDTVEVPQVVPVIEEPVNEVRNAEEQDEVMLPEVAPSHELTREVPVISGEVFKGNTPALTPKTSQEPADAAEIALHENLLAKKGIEATADAALEAAVKIAVDAASATIAAKRIAKKAFADIARTTIKGIRDPYQTRSLLERDFGVSGEELVVLLEAIMLGLENYHAKPSEVVSAAPVLPNNEHKVVKAEQQAMDKRFAAVAGKLPEQKVEPVLPSARVSAARTKEEEVAAQEKAVNAEKLAQAAAASKPAPAKAMLTVGSVPPPPPGEQQVMADVQFRPKLVGPVEELGTMTPAEFRRLSSNPADAAKKIEDILANLEATSYEERIRGVQAWRKSPMNALYTEMAAEALQEGVALAEVASRRRNKGQESLSPAEMKAITSLNARMQF